MHNEKGVSVETNATPLYPPLHGNMEDSLYQQWTPNSLISMTELKPTYLLVYLQATSLFLNFFDIPIYVTWILTTLLTFNI